VHRASALELDEGDNIPNGPTGYIIMDEHSDRGDIWQDNVVVGVDNLQPSMGGRVARLSDGNIIMGTIISATGRPEPLLHWEIAFDNGTRTSVGIEAVAIPHDYLQPEVGDRVAWLSDGYITLGTIRSSIGEPGPDYSWEITYDDETTALVGGEDIRVLMNPYNYFWYD